MLAEALSWALHAIPSNPDVPILNGFFLNADDELSVEASGDDFSMRAMVRSDVSEPGTAVVAAKKLHAVVSALWGPVTLTRSNDTLEVRSDKGNSKYSFQCMVDDDYPRASFQAAPVGRVDADELRRAIGQVAHSISPPNSEPARLRAIHFLNEGGDQLILGSTDRYQLTQAYVPYDGDEIDAPPDGRHVIDIVAGLNGPITIGFSEGRFRLGDADRTAIMRVYEEPFLRFDQAIEAANKKTGKPFDSSFDRLDLLDILDRLNKIHEKDLPIHVDLSADGSAEISTLAQDSHASGVEVIECFSTHTFRIDFNPRKLYDALKVHAGDVIHIQNGSGNERRPMAITDDTNVVTIVNPILLPKNQEH